MPVFPSSLLETRRRISLHVVQPARLLVARDAGSGVSLRELRNIERAITSRPEWRELRTVASSVRRGLGVTRPEDASKYLDVDLCLRANVLRAVCLGLHRTRGLSVAAGAECRARTGEQCGAASTRTSA